MKTYYLTLAAALASAVITLVLFQDVARLAGREPTTQAARSVDRAMLPTSVASAVWLHA